MIEIKDQKLSRIYLNVAPFELTKVIMRLYHNCLTKTDWQYITNVSDLQARKRKCN